MGICLCAKTLSDKNIALLLANPPLVWLVVDQERTDRYLAEIGQSKPPGLLVRLFGASKDWPPDIPALEFAEHECLDLDMDKSWEGINFCLRPLANGFGCHNWFEDGKAIGKIEVGYGPARYFLSQELAAIADCYAQVSEAELLAQLDPVSMKKIYPKGFWSRGDEACRAYLREHFFSLQQFLATAASQRLGAVLWFT